MEILKEMLLHAGNCYRHWPPKRRKIKRSNVRKVDITQLSISVYGYNIRLQVFDGEPMPLRVLLIGS